MRSSYVLAAYIFFLVLPGFTNAEHAHSNARRHDTLARRISNNQTSSQDVSKRDDINQGYLTWYTTGPGTGETDCGVVNGANDFIVALSETTFFPPGTWPSDICFKKVFIQYQGTTVTATVTDACVDCNADPYGHLDTSHALLRTFTNDDELQGITWWFDGDGPDDSTSTSSSSTTTSTAPPSSTTHTSTTASTTSSQTSTTSHSTSHTSSSSTSSSTTSTSTSSHTPTSTPAPTPTEQSVLSLINEGFLGLAAIAAVGDGN